MVFKISLPYSVMQSNNPDTIEDVAEIACYISLKHVCGSYNPCICPWFVATASGPKDFVLVIDLTNSMDRIDGLLKVIREAAVAVVGTLNIDDRFTIMTLTNGVYILLEGSMALLYL